MVSPNIIYEKEFYQLRQLVPETQAIRESYIKYADIKMPIEDVLLRLQGHQQFIKNLFDPTTPYKRLLLNHGTGTGKTVIINTLAKDHIAYFKTPDSVAEHVELLQDNLVLNENNLVTD